MWVPIGFRVLTQGILRLQLQEPRIVVWRHLLGEMQPKGLVGPLCSSWWRGCCAPIFPVHKDAALCWSRAMTSGRRSRPRRERAEICPSRFLIPFPKSRYSSPNELTTFWSKRFFIFSNQSKEQAPRTLAIQPARRHILRTTQQWLLQRRTRLKLL